MIANKAVLALIPARGGSKGIKNKNIIDLCGKPLIAYTVEAARNSKYIDDIVLTTDSKKISQVAKQYGAEVPFMRPAELAGDNSKTIDAVIHALQELKKSGRTYNILVLLQPTQPLRTNDDIDKSLEKFIETGCESIASVSFASEKPELMRTIDRNDRLVPLLHINSTIRRQDMPVYYKVNGCIYINNIDEITNETSFNDNKYPFIMSIYHSVDIDEMDDLKLAEYHLKQTKMI